MAASAGDALSRRIGRASRSRLSAGPSGAPSYSVKSETPQPRIGSRKRTKPGIGPAGALLGAPVAFWQPPRSRASYRCNGGKSNGPARCHAGLTVGHGDGCRSGRRYAAATAGMARARIAARAFCSSQARRGFSICPSMPAVRQLATSAGVALAVMARIGTAPRRPGAARMRRRPSAHPSPAYGHRAARHPNPGQGGIHRLGAVQDHLHRMSGACSRARATSRLTSTSSASSSRSGVVSGGPGRPSAATSRTGGRPAAAVPPRTGCPARLAFAADGPAHQRHQPGGDGEAEAGAFDLGGAGQPQEFLEEQASLRPSMPGPVSITSKRVRPSDGDWMRSTTSPRSGEFHRIGQQVQQHLAQPLRIGADPGRPPAGPVPG